MALQFKKNTEMRTGEDVRPSEACEIFRSKRLHFVFGLKKRGELEFFLLESHKPQKLSFNSTHLEATYFHECKSQGEKNRGSWWVWVIANRQMDDVWGGRTDTMWWSEFELVFAYFSWSLFSDSIRFMLRYPIVLVSSVYLGVCAFSWMKLPKWSEFIKTVVHGVAQQNREKL